MAGFRVVEDAMPAKPIWMAADGASTYYLGQIVTYVAASKAMFCGTVKPLAVPAGVADLTNFQVPAGIVVGLNKYRTASVSATLGQYDGGTCVTQAAQLARDFRGAEGMYAKNDPQVLVLVQKINQSTVIEGPIKNAAIGTAPTVSIDTGGADTTGYTSAGTVSPGGDFTPVANLCTIYCRTGANAGLYRVTADTTSTAPQTTVAFPYDVVAGDTFVRVPLKQGISYIYIGGSDVPGMYINNALGLATNYFTVFVDKLDLRVAGEETAQFRFASMHFDNYRTNS